MSAASPSSPRFLKLLSADSAKGTAICILADVMHQDDDAAEMPLYLMATVQLRVTPEHMRPPVQRQPHAPRVRCDRWTAAQAWTLRRLTAQQKQSRQYLALPMPRRPTARQPV
jgi:hypothetical protein